VSLDRALELVRRSLGVAYPNPTVGAVVVADGEIVGEGVTEPHGGRHGEVVAIAAAAERARGAALYVTMEPCAHHGRTPPCVDAVLAAGIARVVAGCHDPNPDASGGLEQLRAAGVEVELDDRFEARAQNEAWRTWVARGRPFVTYKVAVTLDGRVTVPDARWVTGEESRLLVHQLRASADAVFQSYADRGVFRGFSASDATRQRSMARSLNHSKASWLVTVQRGKPVRCRSGSISTLALES